METMNFFNNIGKLNNKWFTSDSMPSGIIVIDSLMKNVMKHCYLHHIERLMYMGAFFLMAGINPKEVFKWFISICSIDSYHWVMYGNVYCMSQFSTGPLLMTKPYFSSSNYISKMSNYSKQKNVYPKVMIKDVGYEWFEIWDALYYNFIDEHRKYLSKNYSLASHVKFWMNKSKSERDRITSIAKKYKNNYFS